MITYAYPLINDCSNFQQKQKRAEIVKCKASVAGGVKLHGVHVDAHARRFTTSNNFMNELRPGSWGGGGRCCEWMPSRAVVWQYNSDVIAVVRARGRREALREKVACWRHASAVGGCVVYDTGFTLLTSSALVASPSAITELFWEPFDPRVSVIAAVRKCI